MRKCCQNKGTQGCWECADFETCEKLDFLKPAHGDAHIKNLKKIQKKGIKAFITNERQWYSAIKK
jgi:hypothetical protein